MTAFFDRLRSDQALDRALALADEVPDDLIRSRVKAVLAFSLAQASPGDEVVEMVLGGGGRPQVQSLSSARPEGTSGAARPVKA
jgi:hypothetical protein